MKKIIMLAGAITIALGVSAFAQNMNGMGLNQRNQNNINYSMGRGRHHSRYCCENGYIQSKEIESNRISIMEKRVEIRKELIKDTPDWNKVEKLNQEIASKRAENQTIMLKERINNRNI